MALGRDERGRCHSRRFEGWAETHFFMGPGAVSSERAAAQVTTDLVGLAVLAARRRLAVRFALTARTGRRSRGGLCQ